MLIKKFFVALTVATSLLASQARADDIRLPDMGDPAQVAITPDQEHRIGEALLRRLRSQGSILNDPLVNDYITSLGYRLVANSDGQNLDFTFFVVKDSTINAFAAPGGFIGVDTGLMLATNTESELAAVMAHEIAHITQHHLARAFAAASRMKIPLAAAILASILIGSQNAEAGQAALAATTAGSLQQQINFTRANEQEADTIGMQTLARSGFDPMGMPDFFGELLRDSRYYGRTLPEFLRTHPISENRIADARARAERYPVRQHVDSMAYQLVLARLRVLLDDHPEQLPQRFAAELETGQYRNREAEEYGYALALARNHDYAAAGTQLKKLLKKDPDRIEYMIALAGIQLDNGKSKAAISTYEDALALYPDSEPLNTAYARALLSVGRNDTAEKVLRRHLQRHSNDPRLYRMLAEAEGKRGDLTSSREAMAEYFYLNGDLGSAIEQLKLALKGGNLDLYQRSRINARLEELKQERQLAPKQDSP